MHVIVVGAGIGGLSTAIAFRKKGFEVTVYERADGLSQFGASIVASPISARILKEWQLYDRLTTKKYGGMHVQQVVFKRHDDLKVLLEMPVQLASDATGVCLARRDYWRALHDAATELGAKVLFSQNISNIDINAPSITLADGTVAKADLVVASDGLRSRLRSQILSNPVEVYADGVGWSWFVTEEALRNDPATKSIADGPTSIIFHFGADVACFLFPIEGRSKWNVAIKAPSEHQKQSSAKFGELIPIEQVKVAMQGFHPSLQRLAHMTDSAFAWPIGALKQPDRYDSESSKAVVLGDAAHAMNPSLGAGSSIAMEDAYSLAEFVSQAKTADAIPAQVRKWSDFRTARVPHVARLAHETAFIQQVEDGPMQQARDAEYAKASQMMRLAVEKGVKAPKIPPNPHAPAGSGPARAFVTDYDVREECRKAIAV